MRVFEIPTALGLVTLPSLAMVAPDFLREVMKAPAEERAWLLIEELASPATLHVLDQLSAKEMENAMGVWGDVSGIEVMELFRLCSVIDRHSEPLEADLIAAGLRLRHCPSEDFDWHDLKVFIRHVAVTSNLFAVMVPDQAGWTREALLFADMVDLLNVLAWQQTENGHKGRNPPDRVPRPGVAPPKRDGSNPKAAPLSVVKRRMAERHASTAPKNTSPARQDRVQRINNLFSGGR